MACALPESRIRRAKRAACNGLKLVSMLRQAASAVAGRRGSFSGEVASREKLLQEPLLAPDPAYIRRRGAAVADVGQRLCSVEGLRAGGDGDGASPDPDLYRPLDLSHGLTRWGVQERRQGNLLAHHRGEA